MVHCLVPEELYLTKKISLLPEFECPSKSPAVRPVMKILFEIERDVCNETSGGDEPYNVSDRVSKLDWTKADDFNRPWVKIFLPHFKKTMNSFLAEMGYALYDLDQMWYQQYLEGDTHGGILMVVLILEFII